MNMTQVLSLSAVRNVSFQKFGILLDPRMALKARLSACGCLPVAICMPFANHSEITSTQGPQDQIYQLQWRPLNGPWHPISSLEAGQDVTCNYDVTTYLAVLND